MIIKCKMCGGDIQFNPGDTCGQCDHCGCTTTFPKLPDEQRTNLFNRANHFRRQCEFDKAMAAYEHILEVDDTDAEAHWGIVLSKFGIEYVEDPVTHERIPTCHRAQVISILSDEDYQNAIKYAPDTQSRDIYEQEAKRIAEIQKGILAISSQEKPYDVFICYKETDDNGSRTKDSALAQEIYYQLTNEGYKVFFSRITLEDKLGQEYEPYIFAALNSAKVMLVVGTKPENFSAVWVKNEWSRFLAIMKNDRKRVLIPCYRDMDPYDLPEELSALQSQDMGKIGFVQDLVRGIQKVVASGIANSQTVVKQSIGTGANVENLMKRVRLFLEDGDFSRADEYLDRVLDENAEYAPAYIGKILVNFQIHREEELSDCLREYELTPNWQKAIRFATPQQKSTYENYLAQARQTREEKNNDEIYTKAQKLLSKATTSDECRQAKTIFEQIPSYKDSAKHIEECNHKSLVFDYFKATSMLNRASTAQDCVCAAREFERLGDFRDSKEMAKEALERSMRITYNRAKRTLESANTVADCGEAKRLFQLITEYGDSKAQIEKCQEKADRIPYDNAKALFDNAKTVSDYKSAKIKFQEIPNYRDSYDYIVRCDSRIEELNDSTYKHAVQYEEQRKWDDAISLYSSLGKYRDCDAKIKACRKVKEQEEQERLAQQEQERILAEERQRREAEAAAAKKKRGIILGSMAVVLLVAAILLVTMVIIPGSNYRNAVALQQAGKYEEAITAFEALNGYSDSAAQIEACRTSIKERDYQAAVALQQSGKYEEAITAFEALNGYSDSFAQITETKYLKAKYLITKGDYEGAAAILIGIRGYKDVASLLKNDDNLSAAAVAAARDAKYSFGNYVTFGHYPQTSGGSDNTPIEWLVLARDGNKVLLLSRYGLDAKPYNTEYADITWEKCTLRTWLNGTFMNKAFTSQEQAGILLTSVDNSKNQGYSGWSTRGGNNTQDRIFLLSYAEANKYLGVTDDNSNMKSRVEPTAYAIKQGAYTTSRKKTASGVAAGWWWLRSPGTNQYRAARVFADGSISYDSIYRDIGCVRPALWINLESGFF